MLIAGLTGGIATGKSTVARFLREAGAVIVDADQIARQVVAPGLPAWQEIQRIFGKGILTSDGKIDRVALGRIVFADPDARRRLEAVIHPLVKAQIDREIRAAAQKDPDAVVILDIPLLFESGGYDGLAEIIVVYVSPAVQRLRLLHRDGLTAEEAELRIASQMDMAEKMQKATQVIDNSGSLEHTRDQIIRIYNDLSIRARQLG